MNETVFSFIRIAASVVLTVTIVFLCVNLMSYTQSNIDLNINKTDKYIKLGTLQFGDYYSGDYVKNYVKVRNVDAINELDNKKLNTISNKVYCFLGTSEENGVDLLFRLEE